MFPHELNKKHSALAYYGVVLGICEFTRSNSIINSAAVFSNISSDLCRSRSLQTPANILIINLAISDFLMSITQSPVFFTSSLYKHWIFGEKGLYIFFLKFHYVCSYHSGSSSIYPQVLLQYWEHWEHLLTLFQCWHKHFFEYLCLCVINTLLSGEENYINETATKASLATRGTALIFLPVFFPSHLMALLLSESSDKEALPVSTPA